MDKVVVYTVLIRVILLLCLAYLIITQMEV